MGLETAIIAAGASIFGVRERIQSGKKQRSILRHAQKRQENVQIQQQEVAQSEKERLQREQSDELSRRRTRGRRSLLSGDETGVGLSGKRVTTG